MCVRNMQTINKDAPKLAAARKALDYVEPGLALGVGSGSAVNIFIPLVKNIARNIPGAVAASDSSVAALRDGGAPIVDPNFMCELAVYIDGADEVDINLMLIKGGGAALTREKILASAANLCVVMVDR